MTSLATSAEGAMLEARAFVDSFLIAGLGTSATAALPDNLIGNSSIQQTNAGSPVAAAGQAGAGIAELRRLSGLTWEQLARLFKLSRRALHFWASGKPMASVNEEHLQHLLVAIRQVDHGSAGENRRALLAAQSDGPTPLDLLAEGQYDDAIALLGTRTAIARVASPKSSAVFVAARAPRPPAELVDALQDRPHRSTGVARATRSTKVRSGR